MQCCYYAQKMSVDDNSMMMFWWIDWIFRHDTLDKLCQKKQSKRKLLTLNIVVLSWWWEILNKKNTTDKQWCFTCQMYLIWDCDDTVQQQECDETMMMTCLLWNVANNRKVKKKIVYLQHCEYNIFCYV
jgi:hypothetical protein